MDVNIDIFLIFLIPASYFVGSMPSGLVLCKILYNKDIRDEGSGNIGATNVMRATGRKSLFFLTVFLDGVKSGFPVYLSMVIYDENIAKLSYTLSVGGHIFPIYLNFKGGKGMATILGGMAAINHQLCVLFIISWVIVFSITRYSSLSSMISIIVTCSACFFMEEFLPLKNLFIVLCAISFFTHIDNIKRLLQGKEKRMMFKR